MLHHYLSSLLLIFCVIWLLVYFSGARNFLLVLELSKSTIYVQPRWIVMLWFHLCNGSKITENNIYHLPETGMVGTQSILTSATAPVMAWLTYTKQYSTYRSVKRSHSKCNECWPRVTFCSATYSMDVGGASDATSARRRAYKRTRSPDARMHDGYWKSTVTPLLCGSQGIMLRACTLNTNCSLQSAYNQKQTTNSNFHLHWRTLCNFGNMEMISLMYGWYSWILCERIVAEYQL